MRYLIDFINTATNEEISAYITQNSYTVLKQWGNFDKVYLVEGSTVPPVSPLIERFEEENTIAIRPHNLSTMTIDSKFGCHSNTKYPSITVSHTDKKDWWKNYSYNQPNFDSDLTLSRLGESIKVYVVDSGIEETHPEFVDANITKLYSVVPNDFTDNNGHGTALASLIVGKTCGITNAKLHVVKIFDRYHDTLQSEFLDALDAILENHEDNTFAILNASWSIPKNEWVEHKLSLCVQEGIFVLAAAGNSGTAIENVTPASMWEALTIGSYNSNLEPSNFSDYSGPIPTGQGSVNEGELDGWAPGEEIWCASLGGTYDYSGGTSLATAISSAILASNLEWYTTSDDQREFYVQNLIVSTIANSTTNHANQALFGRYDLLDLNDPKYSTSINRIATLIDKCTYVNPQAPDELSRIIEVGQVSDPTIFVPALTKSVEFLDPIPNNFQVSQYGKLHCRPTEENAPAAGEHYRLYTIRLNRTGLDDVTELVTINIYVVNQDKDFNEIPSDDPIIPITLLVNCNQGAGCKSGTASSCVDNCYPFFIGCCATTKDSAFACKCDPG